MSGGRVCIIHPELKRRESANLRSPEAQLEEAVGLALSIDLDIAKAEIIWLSKIVPATYIGGGKVEELVEFIQESHVDLVVVNTSITPIQQRNLEKSLGCKVIDRTALILEIFGARAKTKEGRLQVELAAYEYQKSRLVRSWTHLERQRGGGGFLGGPGETQIESDRRAIRERIESIKKKLSKVVRTRSLHRKARQKVPYPVVALVGYTNAGKSTLFNRLTESSVYAKDQLFATLDPTMRLVELASGRKVIISDTVGFISNLPTELVVAFRATLEEVVEADVLLHVRDIAHEDTLVQRDDVMDVLHYLLPKSQIEDMTIEVWNKSDLIAPDDKPKPPKHAVLVSALTGDGFGTLSDTIDGFLSKDFVELALDIAVENGELLAWVHAHAHVIDAKADDTHHHLRIRISKKEQGRLEKRLKNV